MLEWFDQTVAYWRAGGVLLLPIAAASFLIWGFFLRSRGIMQKLLREGTCIASRWDRQDIGQSCKTICDSVAGFSGGIAQTIALAMRDVRSGMTPEEAFDARGERCMHLLKKDFLLLSAITTVAPLLGLLGTVMGMIETFHAVAGESGETGERVAAGISRALITTQFGLVVALPGVFGLARLRRMARQIEVVMAECKIHAVHALATAAAEEPS